MVATDMARTVVGILLHHWSTTLSSLLPHRTISSQYPPFSTIMVATDMVRTVVGIIGNMIALCLYLSPMPTFIRICKKRTVEDFSPVPYLAALLNCMLSVVYALPFIHPHVILVLTINGSGLVIELCYVLLFLYYSNGKKRMMVLVMLLLETAFVGLTLMLVLLLTHSYTQRTLIIGGMNVVVGTGMYIAPLSIMKLVIQTQSVEYMPFTLSLASFFNGLCWTTYGLLRFDLFIFMPNALGVLFSTMQLILYARYYKSTQQASK